MTIREHFCSFDIVFIAKIKRIKAKKGRAHVQIKFKIRKDKVEDNFTATKESKLKKWFYLADAGDCYTSKKCIALEEARRNKKSLLIMANDYGMFRKNTLKNVKNNFREQKKKCYYALDKLG